VSWGRGVENSLEKKIKTYPKIKTTQRTILKTGVPRYEKKFFD